MSETSHPSLAQLSGDVCFFAHFDRHDKVDEYVFRYLSEISRAGFCIVFVTPCVISDADEARLRTICADVIRRDNSGLDFGSWAEALKRYSSQLSGRLLLANDSVYGPMTDLRDILSRLTATKADFYGLVECRLVTSHLQSWFLLLEPHVVHSEAFKELMSQDFYAMSKK